MFEKMLTTLIALLLCASTAHAEKKYCRVDRVGTDKWWSAVVDDATFPASPLPGCLGYVKSGKKTYHFCVGKKVRVFKTETGEEVLNKKYTYDCKRYTGIARSN